MNNLSNISNDLSAVLEAVPQPAAVLSSDYHIIATNRAYSIHHRISDSVKTKFCYQVTHGYSRPCDESGESCPLKKCQDTNSRQRVLHLHQTSRGREHVDVEMQPITLNDGGRYYLEIMHQVKVAQANPEGQGLIGCSDAFNQMLSLIQRAGPSSISVLLSGESGTGKELAAKALHKVSNRANNPFVTVECSGLSETLFESEMFGHEKGAFTGAINRKDGLVSAARGGTLFLDEIGDVPLSLQVKLLRLIETGTYRTVGGVELKQADFRLVCATHKNLKSLVDTSQFRQDLYYRISAFPIELPPLRERKEDIPLLIKALLKRIPDSENVSLETPALTTLMDHPFPGNIRELRNILERAVLLTDNQHIGLQHLPHECRADIECAEGMVSPELCSSGSGKFVPLADLERYYLAKVKDCFKGNNSDLAEILGVSERTLYRKLSAL
ncbi:MAG: sigma-54 interaction domain-containing protein [Neptuniibacter sp.]